MGNWGYVGVALADFANSLVIIIPTPAPAYTFAMGALLNPVAIGIIGGLAAASDEMIGITSVSEARPSPNPAGCTAKSRN